MTIKKDDIVTKAFENLAASNTYIVASIDGENAFLYHPLYPQIFIKEKVNELNHVQANLKDSTEKSLDFANKNRNLLDYNTQGDLDALCAYFVVSRKLTSRQKQLLSNTCGIIAAIKFNDDAKLAMDLVKKNEGLLDDFNGMWYRSFKKVFFGRQVISSKKQRDVVFNITGFILAELETPTVAK